MLLRPTSKGSNMIIQSCQYKKKTLKEYLNFFLIHLFYLIHIFLINNSFEIVLYSITDPAKRMYGVYGYIGYLGVIFLSISVALQQLGVY